MPLLRGLVPLSFAFATPMQSAGQSATNQVAQLCVAVGVNASHATRKIPLSRSSFALACTSLGCSVLIPSSASLIPRATLNGTRAAKGKLRVTKQLCDHNQDLPKTEFPGHWVKFLDPQEPEECIRPAKGEGQLPRYEEADRKHVEELDRFSESFVEFGASWAAPIAHSPWSFAQRIASSADI